MSNTSRVLTTPFRMVFGRLRATGAGLRALTAPFSRLGIKLPKNQSGSVRLWLESLRPQRRARRRQRISDRAQFSQIHLVNLASSKRVVLHIGTLIGRNGVEFPVHMPNNRPVMLQFTLVDPSESLIPIRLSCVPATTKFRINEIERTGSVYLTTRDTISVGNEHFLYELYALDTAPVATRVDASWATATGTVRDRNEDALGISQHPKGYLFAIADGVGNGQDGDRISAFSVQYLLAVFHKNIALDLAWRDIFAMAYQYINSEVRHYAQTALLPTGSTLTALVIKNWEAHIAHVGDSRLYRLRNGTFEQFTVDHVKRIPAELPTRYANESGTTAPLHDVLTRAIGKEDSIQPEFVSLALQPGDRFLLVTDGITKCLHPNELADMLAHSRLSQVSQQLVELVHERGSDDNASAIAVEIVSEAYLEDTWHAVETDRVFAGNRPRSLRLDKRDTSATATPVISDGCLLIAAVVIVVVVLWLLLGLTLGVVRADGDESVDDTPLGQAAPTNQASLSAYQCVFNPTAGTLTINVALNDENGLPFTANGFQMSARITGADAPFAPDDVSTSGAVERPSFRMILVLDLTDTVPIENILSALNTDLIPRLKPLDELALVTFSDEVSPPTRFYTDKSQLFDDYLVGLTTVEGDNRLYDAVAAAVDLFPFATDTRQVILVLTDSGRRTAAQTPVEDIVTAASADGTQIYSIGFTSEDRPDAADLMALANGTHGFSWLYDETPNTPTSIQSAVGAFLRDYVRLVDGEITVTLDVTDLPAVESNVLPITLTAELPDFRLLVDTIDCPFEVVTHTVEFTGVLPDAPVRGRTDIGVSVSPASADTRVVFRLDGEIVQNSTATIYTLDAADVAPGAHEIQVELWNRSNETLATTAPLHVFTQYPLRLTTSSGDTRDLSGTVEFVVEGNPDYAPAQIELQIARVLDPDAPQSFGSIEIGADGQGSLTVDDISAALYSLFPQLEDRERLQILALVPGTNANEPVLANSDPLVITVERPPVVSTSVGATTVSPTNGLNTLLVNLPILGVVFFGATNILLFRAVRKARIRRLIERPDNHELSPELMSITVYRGGVPQHFTLTKKTVTVGRTSANDINLGEDPNISRKHGVIMWRRRQWYYSNRKGSLSTRINGRRYHGYIFYRLEPMTELQVGSATMVFHSNAQQNISDFIKTDL